MWSKWKHVMPLILAVLFSGLLLIVTIFLTFRVNL